MAGKQSFAKLVCSRPGVGSRKDPGAEPKNETSLPSPASHFWPEITADQVRILVECLSRAEEKSRT